jgi:hypothetical protein
VEKYKAQRDDEHAWRRYYRRALLKLQEEGIRTATDPAAGEDLYVELRRKWQPHILAYADYLLYDWKEVCPGEHE